MPKTFLKFSLIGIILLFNYSCKKADPVEPPTPNSSGNILLSGGTCDSFNWLFPGNQIESLDAVEQTADGGYIVAGSYEHFYESCSAKIFIAKTNCFGVVEWLDTLQQESNHTLADIIKVSSGGFMLTTVYGCGLWSGQMRTGRLIRLNEIGEISWTKDFSIGQPSPLLETFGITETADNGFLLCGARWQTPYVLKVDENGEEVWEQELLQDSYTLDIAVASNQKIFVCGQIMTNNQDDIYLAKLTATGDTIWTKTIDKQNINNKATAILIDSDDDIYLGGYYHSTSSPQYSFVTKLDENGDEIWHKFFDSENLLHTEKIAFATDGNIVGTGKNNSSNLSVYKIDKSTGDLIWQVDKHYFSSISDMKQTSDGGFILCGRYNLEEYENDGCLIKVDENGQ